MLTAKNCHGCKWLDRHKEDGRGYCCHVEHSKANMELQEYIRQHHEEYEYGRKELPSLKVRRPDMERCELYEAGSFSERYDRRGRK